MKALQLNIFTGRSKAVHLLWIIQIFCHVFVTLSCASDYWCLVITSRKKADLLASCVMSNCEVVTFQFYPGSGVVLDCIDS